MLGYYKNPEATAKKIDKDGWLHTGDRGYLDEDGYLYVEGRLEQDMIVLPNGENIHPDNIESKINALPEVAESIVIAREGKLVAIVVVSGELSADSRKALRLSILRSVNAQLPMYAQIYDIEWSEEPLARTAKQTIKRYLYK
jgi:long-chain acyl-CoA synthetase